MGTTTVIIIAVFSALMIAISFGIGVWSKKKANTAQAYFGGTAMFGPKHHHQALECLAEKAAHLTGQGGVDGK